MLDNESANRTHLKLEPLNEASVTSFISITMSRSPEYVHPLSMVCLEKTNGNPFYLRQMLEVCHRRGAIWYSWKESAWIYDLDRVFAEFSSPEYGQQLDTNFITKKLQDLPNSARSILAWASLLGSTFSFRLIQRLVGGEYSCTGSQVENDSPQPKDMRKRKPGANLVEGLQVALQAYVLVSLYQQFPCHPTYNCFNSIQNTKIRRTAAKAFRNIVARQ